MPTKRAAHKRESRYETEDPEDILMNAQQKMSEVRDIEAPERGGGQWTEYEEVVDAETEHASCVST